MDKNKTPLASLAASLCEIMGVNSPKMSAPPNNTLTSYAAKTLGGKADRIFMYNPDALAEWIIDKYPDIMQPVTDICDQAVPMSTVIPSVTPVCFATMYTGAMPPVHGIKEYAKPVLRTDTVFDAMIREGKRVAIVSSEGDSISKIFLERDMDYFIYPTVDEINKKAEELIIADEYDMIVVYNGNYDAAMHRYSPEGVESLEQLRANVNAFEHFYALISSYWWDHNVLVGFAMDHGCHEIDGGCGSHGLDMVEDINIRHYYRALPRHEIKITNAFPGGNIYIKSVGEDEFTIERELRGSEEWFYFAFCCEGAAGRTVRFNLQKNRLGYYGPAVSHDMKTWHWLGSHDGDSFTYSFAPDENKVYFAHHFLYRPERFFEFASASGLTKKTLAVTKKGRDLPYYEFGDGDKYIYLTARHHACESTGSYVLQGFVEAALHEPIDGYKFICVPFMDYDGVCDGDQGKSRYPYDHNRAYRPDTVYPEMQAMMKMFDTHPPLLGIDFHSPWHIGGANDKVFIPQKSVERLDKFIKMGRLIEESITPESMKYYQKDDYPPNVDWNTTDGTTSFAKQVMSRPGSDLGFTLETTYFGLSDNIFGDEKAVELGRCVYHALQKYIAQM